MRPSANESTELAREFEDLRAQHRALIGVLRTIARTEGLQAVLDEVVGAARRLCHGERAQLYMAENDLFVIFSESGDLPAAFEYSAQHPHAADRRTVIGRVALNGASVQIPD